MTPEELRDELLKVINEYCEDTEVLHKAADKCLCKCLETLGYTEAVEIYNRIPKWYS